MDDRKASELIDELRKSKDGVKDNTEQLTDLTSLLKQQNAYLRLNTRATEVLGINLGLTQTNLKTITAGFRVLKNEFSNITDSIKNIYNATVVPAVIRNNQAMTAQRQQNLEILKRIGTDILNASLNELNGSVKDLIPVSTGNIVRLALFQAGLERNSESLGRFLARSELLGENLEEVTFNIRNLTNSVGLNSVGQNVLIDAVSLAAGTYKTSTESVLKGLTKLSKVMAVVNARVNPETTKLLGLLQGMVDRIAPESIATALGPLLTQGAESLRVAGTLGVAPEMQRIQAGTGPMSQQIQDVQRIMRAFVGLRDQFATQDVESNILLAEVIEKLTNLDLEQIESLRIAERAIQENKYNQQQLASLNDAQLSVSKILAHMFDAFQIIKDQALLFLGKLSDKFGPETLAKIGVVAAGVGVLSVLLAGMTVIFGGVLLLLSPLAIILSAILSATVAIATFMFSGGSFGGMILKGVYAIIEIFTGGAITKTLFGWMFGVVTGPITNAVQGLGSQIKGMLPPYLTSGQIFDDLLDGIDNMSDLFIKPTGPTSKTSEHTGDLAELARQEEARREKDSIGAYASKHAKILGELIRMSTRQDVSDDMLALTAQASRVELNMKVGNLIDEMILQNNLIRSGNSGNPFSSGDGRF